MVEATKAEAILICLEKERSIIENMPEDKTDG